MIGDLKVLVVGRSSQGSDADIQVPASEDTVGRKHAEITLGNSGGCHIVDLGSKNGTFIRDGRGWRKVTQAAVGVGDSIRIGDYVTTVAQLLTLRCERSHAASRPAAPEQPAKFIATSPPSDRKPRRNPLTGEIE